VVNRRRIDIKAEGESKEKHVGWQGCHNQLRVPAAKLVELTVSSMSEEIEVLHDEINQICTEVATRLA